MIAQAKKLRPDEGIMSSIDRPSMTTPELTIDSEPQSSASTTHTPQNGRMEILELDLIVSDDELKVRFETDQQTIHDYYEAMETEEDVLRFPPLVVYFDGFRYWLADGHHRYWAIFRRGFKKVPVKVIDGTHDDAVLAAVKLNSKNGLRFNDDDWEKIIPLIASKPQWKNWSNRKLAEELTCSYKTVERYRPESSVGTGVPTEKRRGKDGKMYKAKKDKKPKVIPPTPEIFTDTATQTPHAGTSLESPTPEMRDDHAASVKTTDESFEYESPYTVLPRNKDGVEVVPPLPSTTSPKPRVIPASIKNWPHENEDTLVIGEGEKEKTEPLYYGGVRPTAQCPFPGGYGSRPFGATTLRHIPREHPNRLTASLFDWFPPGYVVEMVLDAMQQLQKKQKYGPQVTNWVMRQLNKKYGRHTESAVVENSDVLPSKPCETSFPEESLSESSMNAYPTELVQPGTVDSSGRLLGSRFNDWTPSEFVQTLTASYPEWFTQSVLGHLLVLEQKKRFHELTASNGAKRRVADPIISELFHRLGSHDCKVTFSALFDKMLRENRKEVPKLMEEMTRKVQLQTAKSKSNSPTS